MASDGFLPASPGSPGANASSNELGMLASAAIREVAESNQAPSAVNWDAVSSLVEWTNERNGAPAADVLAEIKPAVKSPSPAQALRALTVLDTVARSVGASAFAELGSRKWIQRLVKLASGASDGRVRVAVQQLLADWSVTCPRTGSGSRAPFENALSTLARSHAIMPPAGSDGNGCVGGIFVRGRQFSWDVPAAAASATPPRPQQQVPPPTHYTPPPPVTAAYNSPPMMAMGMPPPMATPQQAMQPAMAAAQQPLSPSELVSRMRGDLDDLGRACSKMRESASDVQAVQQVAEQSAGTFERCLRWQEGVSSLLEQPLSEGDLMSVLDMNDRLNTLIPRWQALLSSSTGEHSEESSEGVASRRLTADDLMDSDFGVMGGGAGVLPPSSSSASDAAELEALRRELATAKATAAAELASAAAAHAEEVANVKSLAVNKLKELQRENEELRTAAAGGGGGGGGGDDASQADDGAAEKVATAVKAAEVAEMRAAELEAEVAQGVASLNAARGEMEALRVKMAALEAEASNVMALKSRAEASEAAAKRMELELRKESVLRKKAYNQIRELRGNIRVVARVRPATAGSSEHVQSAGEGRSCTVSDEYTCQLLHDDARGDSQMRRYEFDACLPEGTTQEQVYDEVGDVVQSALDGYKVCVFAYGQTGSGKTHTMVGSDDAPGLLPRCARQMFAGGDSKGCVTVRCQILELYQDNLVDLLHSGSKGSALTIRRDASTGNVSVENAETVTCTDADALLDVCKKAFSRRATASTKMNVESSRSHLMLMFSTEHVADNTGAISKGKLTLVDLAGSERVKKSGAEGKLLDEAKAINQSLSALGDVVSALTKGEKHIPYRNSRLTQLMSDSLGGQAKTLMIVNVSPLGEDSSETKNSLDYASRVKLVTNDASKSIETKTVLALKKEVDELKKKLLSSK
ncbi:kinesin-like protein [Pycnococcus provasolii]